MRLIDVDALLARWKAAELHMLKNKYGKHPISLETIVEEIRTRPTIDAVPVVRCKDCLYSYVIKKKDGSTHFHKCDFFDIEIEEFDFCSSGERK